MAIQSPMDLFVWMLSDVRHRTDMSKQLFTEISKVAEDPDIKQAIDAHVYVQGSVLARLDHIFDMIGKNPVSTESRFRELAVEDFRNELNTIQAPEARLLYVASKLSALVHLHAAEYKALMTMAEVTGNYGVSGLLETCYADSLVFADRLSYRVREFIESTVPMRKAA